MPTLCFHLPGAKLAAKDQGVNRSLLRHPANLPCPSSGNRSHVRSKEVKFYGGTVPEVVLSRARSDVDRHEDPPER